MCEVLQFARSTFYYEANEKDNQDEVTTAIVEIFRANRNAYGTRKIKVKLKEQGWIVSRRRIGRIMLLRIFDIGRSLSMKGCPYDNVVAEATYKMMKTEFVNQTNFLSLHHLKLELYDYVNWFNKHRIHGTLGYMTPVQYKAAALNKVI